MHRRYLIAWTTPVVACVLLPAHAVTSSAIPEASSAEEQKPVAVEDCYLQGVGYVPCDDAEDQ